MAQVRFRKQPDEVLDYIFDFSLWMPAGDTIASATVTATGLIAGSKTIESGSTIVRQFISGGSDGVTYTVTCQIVTTQGRTKDLSALLEVSTQQ